MLICKRGFFVLNCCKCTVCRWDSWKKLYLCESPKKENVWHSLSYLHFFQQKRHLMFLLSSNCHLGVWLQLKSGCKWISLWCAWINVGGVNWSWPSAGLKPRGSLDIIAAESHSEIPNENQSWCRAWGWWFWAVAVSWTCRGLFVFICTGAQPCEAKRVCLMQDTATTAKQSVWQASQEIPYSSLFGMQSCLPDSQQLCKRCFRPWQKGHWLG